MDLFKLICLLWSVDIVQNFALPLKQLARNGTQKEIAEKKFTDLQN